MKNKKKQRERLGQTGFDRPEEYSKVSVNSPQKANNGNGVGRNVEKSDAKRASNGIEDKSPRKKAKNNDSPKAKKTISGINENSALKESSGKNEISQLFSDHVRLLPGVERIAMTKSYSTSTP